MFRTRTLSLLLVLVLAACGGGDSSPTGPGGGGGGGSGQPIVTANGTMSATINGVFWSANFIIPPTITDPPGIGGGSVIGIGSGSPSGTSIAFAWVDLGAPVTYTIGAQNSIGFNANATFGGGNFTAGPGGQPGTGTLTVTSLTANRITGTFSFNMVPALGQAGSGLTVTNGQFDITF